MNDVLSLNRFISISVNVNFDWRLNHVVHNDFFAKGFCCKLSLFVPYIFLLSIQANSSVRGDMDYDEVVSFLFMFVCEYVSLSSVKVFANLETRVDDDCDLFVLGSDLLVFSSFEINLFFSWETLTSMFSIFDVFS